MTATTSDPGRPLPAWLIALGSVLVTGHVLALIVQGLARPSGPWYSPMGPSLAEPPQFAKSAADVATRCYLQPLKLARHLSASDLLPSRPGISLEVRLKDRDRQVFKVVQLPDGTANPWVRHRQSLLLHGLAPDVPVAPRPGELIAAPGHDPPSVPIWEVAGERRLRLEWKPEHLIPRNRDVWRPSEWSLVLARSFARRLCREHGAESAEVIRRTREPIRPEPVLRLSQVPALEDLTANYGEFKP